jgi:hypothetical protein
VKLDTVLQNSGIHRQEKLYTRRDPGLREVIGDHIYELPRLHMIGRDLWILRETQCHVECPKQDQTWMLESGRLTVIRDLWCAHAAIMLKVAEGVGLPALE